MEPRIDQAERRINASPTAIFEAMIDPVAVARWLPPEGMTARIHAFDPRPGGDYRMTLSYTGDERPEGKAGGGRDEVVGQFAKVERDRMIEQVVEFPSHDSNAAGMMTLRWTIEPNADGALVRVEARDVPPAIDAEVHRKALASTLAKLDEEINR
ncbi:SRPBCC domain-containing protein [Croceicoccus sp. BE223]|uniref:SRPBCC domain-containing protein n=1 Tax=Croceicoccus sp. BE223 TaxID=2817716 RepID=UPI002861E81A|nr:SRPBCC domain-containing protein [Croceicoccus sp. BE223]MDR7101864.1 uncharacterized protein YndB with AHSA1/START domain [Croceicoccus sp. BE223]